MDVYVTEQYPFYQVWVNGKVFDTFEANRAVNIRYNRPLTWTEQWDVAEGYREALDTES